jgi:hypothetical protein
VVPPVNPFGLTGGFLFAAGNHLHRHKFRMFFERITLQSPSYPVTDAVVVYEHKTYPHQKIDTLCTYGAL